MGYDIDPVSRKLVINEQEAEAVRLIFRRYIEGWGYGKIADELAEKGYRTKRGGVFLKNSLHSIVCNPKYVGDLIYNRSTAKDMDGKRNGHAYKPEKVGIEPTTCALRG